MKKITIEFKYEIGRELKFGDRKYSIVGIEYVPQRTNRYILLHINNGEAKWDYFYEFEIEFLVGK